MMHNLLADEVIRDVTDGRDDDESWIKEVAHFGTNEIQEFEPLHPFNGPLDVDPKRGTHSYSLMRHATAAAEGWR